MKRLLIFLPALFLSLNSISQYKIQQLAGANPFVNRKLAILCDGPDSLKNAALGSLFSRYWKAGAAIVVKNQHEIEALERKEDFVFVRHAARIQEDERGPFRTDYLDFYQDQWNAESLATFYIDNTSMTGNELYIKFFMRALANAALNLDSSDRVNLDRNSDDLAALRRNTLYIPARMLAGGNDKLLEGIAESKTPIIRGEHRPITFGSYTFRYKIVNDEELNKLASDDVNSVFVANLVTLPDHSTGFYIYNVNAGKILYRSNQVEAQINLASIKDLNVAIMKTRLQSSL